MLEAQSKTLNQNKSVGLSLKNHVVQENNFFVKKD